MNLREVLDSKVNGATFISIDTLTPVILRGGKSNPFQGIVTKEVTGSSVMLFQNKASNGYDNMVKRRLQKEGKDPESFVIGPRQWGTREQGTPFVTHKGKTYLEVIFLSAGIRKFLVSGMEMNPSLIPGLDLEKDEGHQGGLENKVLIRTYNVDNIVRLTIDKRVYEATRRVDEVVDFIGFAA